MLWHPTLVWIEMTHGEEAYRKSHSFKLAELNLAPLGPKIVLPFLSRAAKPWSNITWATEIPPGATVR